MAKVRDTCQFAIQNRRLTQYYLQCKHPRRPVGKQPWLLWTLEPRPAIQILFESLSLRLKAFTLSSKREQAQVFLHYLKLLLLPRSLLLYLIAYSDTKQPSKDIFKDIYGPLEWSEFPRTFPEFLVCKCHNTTFLPQMYPNNLLGMKRGMRRLRAVLRVPHQNDGWLAGFYLKERKGVRKYGSKKWKENFCDV